MVLMGRLLFIVYVAENCAKGKSEKRRFS